ncbi:MAG: VTT domain-containing protein [Chitinophagaceae bacterium]|nr:VTT domain-containing protein [Chitinophagaceae bacterium]
MENFNWLSLLQPQFYIENGGLWLIIFIVFAETGLFAGFFLPGDSLLFVTGIYAIDIIKVYFPIENPLLCLLFLISMVSFAGILGNSIGYWTGHKVGKRMYQWKDNLFFKQAYLIQASEFYEKHGKVAIFAARFLPFIRTFAPIVAGIVNMDKKQFSFFNIIGSITWVSSMILGGFFLQKIFLKQFGFDLTQHLEIIVIGIVAVTTFPVLFKFFTSKKQEK